MKLTLLQENLLPALNQLQKTLPSKPQLPILSAVLLSSTKKQITLAATDLYLGIKTSVLGSVDKEGEIAIPGKLFRDIIASLEPGKLTLELKGESLTIKSEKNKSVIQCLPSKEFPEFPQIEGQEYDLSFESVKEIEEKIGFCASLDPTRPVLSAILFEFKGDELLVVGTDGFRLATLKLSVGEVAEPASFLVPAKALAEVVRTATQTKEKVVFTVSQELKQAFFSVDGVQLFVRLIEGEYPPYSKIIPSDFKTAVTLDGEELESQLKRALVFARETSNIVRLKIGQEKLAVTAISPSYGQHEGEMELSMAKGEESEIAFNVRYLIDFLAALKPEKVSFYMNESLTPALVRPEGEENYQHIVMPFRVNE